MESIAMFKKAWKVAAFCIFATTIALPLHAGSIDSKGTAFFFAFPPNHFSGTQVHTISIAAEQNAKGTVEVPGLAINIPFTVQANTITVIDLPSVIDDLPHYQKSNLGIKVLSDNEVTVYGLNYQPGSSDAFLALPADALGIEYLAMSRRSIDVINRSEIVVVGAYENTTVTVNPSAVIYFDYNIYNQGDVLTFTIHAGETALLTSPQYGVFDLTGTAIKADKPVAVMSGAKCAIVLTGAWCDHLVEMMPPVSTWGKSFLTVPLATRKKGDLFRVLASEDNTTVTINGSEVAVINRGEYFEITLTERAQITTTAPALVAQHSAGQGFDSVPSDPFMMLVPPSEQFLNNYTFAIADESVNFINGFVNVVIASPDIASVTLDGQLVDSSLFKAIGQSGFSGAQIPLAPGSHHITATAKFGIHVYGFGNVNSYGYPGGMAFDLINSRGDAYPPSVKLVTFDDRVEGIAGDDEDINLNGILDLGEDINQNNVLDRRTEDLNGNGVLDIGEDKNNDGALDRDTGIFRIELEPTSDNLQLNLSTFSPGALQTAFTVSSIDPALNATGVLVVTDGAGNTTRSPIEFLITPVLSDVKVVSRMSNIDIDLDNSSFTQQPFNITVSGGQTFIEWRFDHITVDQIEQLDYDVVLRNPLPGETRLVTHSLELSYTDANGNVVRRDMGEQVVKVLPSVFNVSVGTDRDTYTADEVVSINAAITNLSDFAASTDLRLSVKDASGIVVEQLNLYSEVNIDANAQQTYPGLSFNTTNFFAGKYEVHAQLLDDNGQVYASAVAAFLIVTPTETSISANIFTDKVEYDPLETVTVTDRIRNIVPNALIDGMTVETAMYAPDGKLFWVQTEALPQLMPNSLKDLLFIVSLGNTLPGQYRIALTVVDEEGVARAIDETTITVKTTADTGAGLVGVIDVAPNPVFKSETILISAKVSNSGNTAFDGATLLLSLIDPLNESVITQWTVPNIDLRINDEFTFERTWEAWGDIGATYVAILSTEIAGERRTLASQAITIADKFEVDFSESDKPRLLVLLDDISHCGSDDEDDDDSGSDSTDDSDEDDNAEDEQDCASSNTDSHGPSDAPLLSEQRSYLEDILNAQGWSYTIVTDGYAFADELRTGSYNAYALFSEQVKLAEQLQQELREAIFRGEGLVIAGDHDYRNNKLDTTLGVQVRGKLRSPDAISIEPVENFLAATAVFSLTEKVRHIELREAETVATYPGLSVCSGDDANNHDDASDDDSDDDYHPNCSDAAVAVAHNHYGYGHSVYAGFYLLAQAALSGADPLFTELLIEALEDIKADTNTPLTSSVIPVTLALTNQGIATPGQAVITLPVGSQIIDDGSAITQPDGNLLWIFDLAENTTETLTFWLRLPEMSGPAHIDALLKVGSAADLKDYNSLLLILNLNQSPRLTEVRDELAALKSQHKDYKKAHEKVEKALQYLYQGKPDKALKEALKAADYLTGLDHPDAKAIHRKLAYAIRDLERQLEQSSPNN